MTYREVRELGSGTFGTVHLVKNTETDEFLARKDVGDVVDILVGVRELDVLYKLKTLNNPSLISIKDYSLAIESDKYAAEQYLEYCSGGSMDSLLETEAENPDQGIKASLGDLSKRISDYYKVIGVLQECQKMGVYHLDMKTENILYKGKNHDICLCDFSNYMFSNNWKGDMNPPVTFYEALLYRPAEIGLMRTDWGILKKADVWAMGIAGLELFGCWDFVMELDSRVCSRVAKITGAISKTKNLQLIYSKKIHGKAGLYPPMLPPHQLYLSEIIPSNPPTFGTKISDETSMEHSYVWGLVMADEVRKLNFEELYERAVRYFTVRKSSSLELDSLKKLFTEVFPNMLKIRSSERWTFEQCLEALDVKPREDVEITDNIVPEVSDSFYRIPDPVWIDCFKTYVREISDMYITYGNKSIKYPLQTIVYTKALFEHTCEILMSNIDDHKDIFPSDSDKRLEFYNQLLRACILVSSELFDFIFPCESSNLFTGSCSLKNIAPFIKLVVELNVGGLTTMPMNTVEHDVIQGRVSIQDVI